MQKFEKDYKAYIDRYTAWMVEQFYLKNGQSETRQEFAERFEAGNGKTPQRVFEDLFYTTFDADIQKSVKSLYSEEYSLFVRDGNAIPPEDGGTYEPTVTTRVTE